MEWRWGGQRRLGRQPSARVLATLGPKGIEEVVDCRGCFVFATKILAVALMHDPGRKQRAKFSLALL
jgi:hypothetical protein